MLATCRVQARSCTSIRPGADQRVQRDRLLVGVLLCRKQVGVGRERAGSDGQIGGPVQQAVVEGALKEIAELGHELTSQIILVTDNGPAMKARRFRNFVKKTELLIHVRSRKYHPQTIGREERYHGSLKLEHLYRVLPNNRTELIAEVKKYRQFYNYDRLHMSLGYRTPAAVYLNKDGHTL